MIIKKCDWCGKEKKGHITDLKQRTYCFDCDENIDDSAVILLEQAIEYLFRNFETDNITKVLKNRLESLPYEKGLFRSANVNLVCGGCINSLKRSLAEYYHGVAVNIAPLLFPCKDTEGQS